MRLFSFVPHYILWHYTRALKEIVAITGTCVWFFWHFFSIRLLASTLFQPWQRIHENRKRGLDIGNLLGVLILNTIMRAVGVVVRLTFLTFGFTAITLAIFSGIAVFIVWLVAPALAVFLLVFGFILLVKPA